MSLIRRNLAYYWQTNLGVLLAVILCSGILAGALFIGDSVRYSLERLAQVRLGKITGAITKPDGFFRQQLAPDLIEYWKSPEGKVYQPPIIAAPLIQLSGIAANPDGSYSSNSVQVLGVEDDFWSLQNDLGAISIDKDGVLLGTPLAAALQVKVDDEIVLRVRKPGMLPGEAPLSVVTDMTEALRLRVQGILGDEELGRFSLQANQILPANAFVNLEMLQEKLGRPELVNLILVSAPEKLAAKPISAALETSYRLADASLELQPIGATFEIRSNQIFLPPPQAQAIYQAFPQAAGIFTYFANEIRLGTRATPYSFICGITDPNLTPPGMADNEIIINEWLAEDLAARPGDKVTLTYFTVEPGRKFIEEIREFKVRAVVPIAGAAADRDLMPSFPGLADEKNCRDWKPGITIDLGKIRDKDQAYWDQYQGTPKAFVTLKTAQAMWGNRYGNLTALRLPAAAGKPRDIETAILQKLTPERAGLAIVPVAQQAQAAAGQSMQFGYLFLGFSFFLIVSALLLMGLLFAFGIEQRNPQIGLLLALGYRPGQVRRTLMGEGFLLALFGSFIGAALGIYYARLMLHGLATVWQQAVGGATIYFHAGNQTMIAAIAGGVLTALLAMLWIIRRQTRRPARELLTYGIETPSEVERGAGRAYGFSAILPLFASFGAVVFVLVMAFRRPTFAPLLFFAAGALLLVTLFYLCWYLFYWYGQTKKPAGSLFDLGLRNAARRRGRSLAVIVTLACGSFLLVSVGRFRLNAWDQADRRGAGTGGYSLFAETTFPIYENLNTRAGLQARGLDPQQFMDTRFVPFRLLEGDDASCQNLNRPQRPGLLGVDWRELSNREAFSFAKALGNEPHPWRLLQVDEKAPDVVPAIADETTMTWALHKQLGEEIPYVDENGRSFRLRLVAALNNSVLQGRLIIPEEAFLARFPSHSGYQVFLVDAPANKAAELSRLLSRSLRDFGAAVTPAADRLARFYAVQNTYIAIFQVLGGLGLLLGSLGLALVMLRNVLERRGELAMLRAVGYRKQDVKKLILTEHELLLLMGLLGGIAAALLALWPAMGTPGLVLPRSLLILLALTLAAGALVCWLAAALALRGRLLPALRSE